MKTAVKHEFQIIPRTFGNQFILKAGEQKSSLAAKEGVFTRTFAAGLSRQVRSTSMHQRKRPRRVMRFP